MSDVGVCNLAYAGRLEELRAQLQRDRALATKADQVSRLRRPPARRSESERPVGPLLSAAAALPAFPLRPPHCRSPPSLPQDHRTALHWACSAGHADVADLLLGLGVPVSDKDDVSVAAVAGLLLHPGEGLAWRLRECRETVCVGNSVAKFLSGPFAVTVPAAEVPLPLCRVLTFLPPPVSWRMQGGFWEVLKSVCVIERQV